MAQPTANPRLALVSVATLAAAGLACNLLSGSEPTAAATAAPTEPPTAAAVIRRPC